MLLSPRKKKTKKTGNSFVQVIIKCCAASLPRSQTPRLKAVVLIQNSDLVAQILQTKPKHHSTHWASFSLYCCSIDLNVDGVLPLTVCSNMQVCLIERTL